jgi:hypothetical protein
VVGKGVVIGDKGDRERAGETQYWGDSRQR